MRTLKPGIHCPYPTAAHRQHLEQLALTSKITLGQLATIPAPPPWEELFFMPKSQHYCYHPRHVGRELGGIPLEEL